LHGSANRLMTQNFITKMRRNKVIDETLKFNDGEEKEVGQISMYFKLHIEALEDKIYEDVWEIEKIYYDPFLQDEAEILRQLDKVEKVLSKKQKEYVESLEKYDVRTEAMWGLAVDLAMLRKQKDDMDEYNHKLWAKYNQLRNVNDVHIQIDVLSTTVEGVY